MIILGIDYGDAHTGIAVCDQWENMATPACVIHEYDYQKRLEKTAEVAKTYNAELLVVGFPKNMDNTIGAKAQTCQAFAEDLHQMTGLPVELWDERCTTVTAHRYLNDTNTRGKKRKNKVDAVAATVLLESYLAYRKNTAIS